MVAIPDVPGLQPAAEGRSEMTMPYTSPDGVVHIRDLGTGQTLCGVRVADYTDTNPVDSCELCVRTSLHDYAKEQAEKLCGWSNRQPKNPGQLS